MLRLLLMLAFSVAGYGQNLCTQSLIMDVAVTGTTALVAPATNSRLYVCGLYLDTQPGTGSPVVTLQYGAGTGCSSSATALFAIPVEGAASQIVREVQTYLTANQGLCLKVSGDTLTAGRLQLLYGTAPGTAVTLTGSFVQPNGTAFTGRLEISLTRSTVTDGCVTPAVQRIMRPITVAITNGTLGSVTLPPSGCLTPRQLYHIRVFDARNLQVYRADWNLPNSGAGTLDVTQIR